MIQSFNYAVGQGIVNGIESISPIEITTPSGKEMVITLANIMIDKPNVPCSSGKGNILDSRLFPRQCIESGTTYKSSLSATIEFCYKHSRSSGTVKQSLGYLPIMVRSNLCNLHGLNPADLVACGEDLNNPGGYFIINGSKKILRLLTAQRRNYPIAISRDTWKQKQKDFTDKGILLTSVAKDETTTTNVLHYLNTGYAKLEFFVNKRPFIIDLVIMLKAFKDINDRELVRTCLAMRGNDTFFIEKIKEMLTDLASQKLFTSSQCQEYIGKSFRPVVKEFVPDWFTDVDVCNLLLEKYVFIHLNDKESKFNFLCSIACKLYAYIAGEAVTESLDVTSMMEAHLSGFLYLKYLKEKLQDMLTSIKWLTIAKMKSEEIDYVLNDADFRKICTRTRKVGPDMESMVTTGNLSSRTGIGLNQQTGLSVVLEGLNRMRDLSHLRAIHRGSYFIEMKTVLPRRLTGEAWGFICPVHTPDGAPCGLLNHLAYNCTIPAHPPAHDEALFVKSALKMLGMVSMSTELVLSGALFYCNNCNNCQWPILPSFP